MCLHDGMWHDPYEMVTYRNFRMSAGAPTESFLDRRLYMRDAKGEVRWCYISRGRYGVLCDIVEAYAAASTRGCEKDDRLGTRHWIDYSPIEFMAFGKIVSMDTLIVEWDVTRDGSKTRKPDDIDFYNYGLYFYMKGSNVTSE